MASYSSHNSNGRSIKRRPLSITGFATAAAAAYGTYCVASWAWKKWHNEEEDELDASEQHSTNNSRANNEHVSVMTNSSSHRNHRQRQQQQPQSQEFNHLNSHYRRLRSLRISRCESETIAALSDFLPTLRTSLSSRTDFSSCTKALKRIRNARAARLRQLRGSRIEGEAAATAVVDIDDNREKQEERIQWETIKIHSLSRVMSTVYAHTLLYLVLHVQVHLLGGKLLHQEETERRQQYGTGGIPNESMCCSSTMASSKSATESMEEYHASHKIVLTRTYDYFFRQGLDILVETVALAVQSRLAGWDVMDVEREGMGMEEVEFRRGMNAVRSIVETPGDCCNTGADFPSNSGDRSSLVRFVIEPDDEVQRNILSKGEANDHNNDPLAKYILEETWDILESPAFEAAEKECLDVTFRSLVQGGWGGVFKVGGDANGDCSDILSKHLPLASVLTQMKKVVNTFYTKPKSVDDSALYEWDISLVEEKNIPSYPNVHLPLLDKLMTVKELGDVSFN